MYAFQTKHQTPLSIAWPRARRQRQQTQKIDMRFRYTRGVFSVLVYNNLCSIDIGGRDRIINLVLFCIRAHAYDARDARFTPSTIIIFLIISLDPGRAKKASAEILRQGGILESWACNKRGRKRRMGTKSHSSRVAERGGGGISPCSGNGITQDDVRRLVALYFCRSPLVLGDKRNSRLPLERDHVDERGQIYFLQAPPSPLVVVARLRSN